MAKISEERKNIFLSELRRHGIVRRAAKAASPHADGTHFASASFYKLRARDHEFAAAWDDAQELAAAEVEYEIHRRAVEGYEEPVYQRGELVGTITKYSDRLLELRAKGLMPERYAIERRDMRIQGQVGHEHQHYHHHSAVLLELRPEDIILLPEEKRETLLGLLNELAEARGDAEPIPRLPS
ncbi:hypothetical protein [Microbulbifer hydrolyticus]|uniref:Terminase small subunit n=1 Tax=Microbulbifer hydrolyticus TaxID=48074 RepID=A0A6P1TBS9_9GAMM|nr:hypothetical protein [Microbulbifer hydrolyticus]MBB5212617.1 hypothetical protein [Microbulbifer hydrolyticus]QHQ40224.1 hypothetical protein GTQ55_15385 [Microbulbifer hydrolyticus]